MIDLISTTNAENKPSILLDPFKSSKVESIACYVTKGMFDKKFSCWGKVEFVNGGTEATQKFKAETFGELVRQIDDFIKSLDK